MTQPTVQGGKRRSPKGARQVWLFARVCARAFSPSAPCWHFLLALARHGGEGEFPGSGVCHAEAWHRLLSRGLRAARGAPPLRGRLGLPGEAQVERDRGRDQGAHERGARRQGPRRDAPRAQAVREVAAAPQRHRPARRLLARRRRRLEQCRLRRWGRHAARRALPRPTPG
jgi:hypothetical protein